ncbi:hypothetical protein KIL84_004250 [Mauremys mutica]|uniref:Uncharacterized protein n=1 Tax=Mauremys mutica TaxID=74926 RepID=A0A9D4B644_9SAUR|nr:hypothetical protein KIL84_004250 [Mauremys mutica]
MGSQRSGSLLLGYLYGNHLLGSVLFAPASTTMQGGLRPSRKDSSGTGRASKERPRSWDLRWGENTGERKEAASTMAGSGGEVFEPQHWEGRQAAEIPRQAPAAHEVERQRGAVCAALR